MESTHTPPGPAPTAIARWATDAVPPAQRLDYWIGAICEGFLEMDVSARLDPGFRASLEAAPLGPLVVNRVSGSAQDVYRTPRAVAQSRDNFYYLLRKADVPWHAAQNGREARLLPGDMLLVDSRFCYEFHFPLTANTLSIELPPAWLEAWLPQPTAQLGRRIDGQSGWGLTLSSFMHQLSPEVAAASPLPGALMADQLGALLALATGSAAAGETGEAASAPGLQALARRVRERLQQRHAEPGLTAGAIAADLGVSERTLHRCLARGGATFGQCLVDCRMAVARRLLDDARFDRLTVAEIGRRVGLADASHFIRQCRRQFGATPGELRRRR
ncbi:helix-turn-helix domain-containing protein [Variovorax sp. RT4R15]|uniref:helix-turn-helix domain-containing protein n=1 Tax=Variovorax sp. RT4R15 TaxID=3443737 RepID=UPI003F45D7EB